LQSTSQIANTQFSLSLCVSIPHPRTRCRTLDGNIKSELKHISPEQAENDEKLPRYQHPRHVFPKTKINKKNIERGEEQPTLPERMMRSERALLSIRFHKD
jgi:hypothetical protein